MVGGIALILGIGTRVVSVLIGLILIGAIVKVKLAICFVGTEMAGYELDLAFLVIALFLAVNGSKHWAMDNLVFNRSENN